MAAHSHFSFKSCKKTSSYLKICSHMQNNLKVMVNIFISDIVSVYSLRVKCCWIVLIHNVRS